MKFSDVSVTQILHDSETYSCAVGVGREISRESADFEEVKLGVEVVILDRLLQLDEAVACDVEEQLGRVFPIYEVSDWTLFDKRCKVRKSVRQMRSQSKCDDKTLGTNSIVQN